MTIMWLLHQSCAADLSQFFTDFLSKAYEEQKNRVAYILSNYFKTNIVGCFRLILGDIRFILVFLFFLFSIFYFFPIHIITNCVIIIKTVTLLELIIRVTIGTNNRDWLKNLFYIFTSNHSCNMASSNARLSSAFHFQTSSQK